MFSKSFLLAGAAIAALALAGPAWADSTENTAVDVKIEVAPIVSVWSAESTVDLTVTGGRKNAAAAKGTLYLLNNVPAELSVSVGGNLPADLNFYILGGDTRDVATVVDQDNADDVHDPDFYDTNYHKWTSADLDPDVTYPLGNWTSDHRSAAVNYPVTYAVDAPMGPPDVNTYSLQVTYTITAN